MSEGVTGIDIDASDTVEDVGEIAAELVGVA